MFLEFMTYFLSLLLLKVVWRGYLLWGRRRSTLFHKDFHLRYFLGIKPLSDLS